MITELQLCNAKMQKLCTQKIYKLPHLLLTKLLMLFPIENVKSILSDVCTNISISVPSDKAIKTDSFFDFVCMLCRSELLI